VRDTGGQHIATASTSTERGPLLGQDWSDRRADARRNRRRIETAAVDVFAERGLDATVPEIAVRAGVGKATVYRSFPSKEDLVRAVALHLMEWIEAHVRVAIDEMPTGDAVDRMTMAVIASHTNVAGAAIPGTEDTVARVRELMGQLLDDGIRRGGAAARLIDADIRDPEV
jgi:AcrR family transcriptional regulator